MVSITSFSSSIIQVGILKTIEQLGYDFHWAQNCHFSAFSASQHSHEVGLENEIKLAALTVQGLHIRSSQRQTVVLR